MTAIKRASLIKKAVCDGFVMAVCDALNASGGAGLGGGHH